MLRLWFNSDLLYLNYVFFGNGVLQKRVLGQSVQRVY